MNRTSALGMLYQLKKTCTSNNRHPDIVAVEFFDTLRDKINRDTLRGMMYEDCFYV